MERDYEKTDNTLLGHNQLTQLPHEIGLLQNLVELSVGNNQLVNAKECHRGSL